MPKTLDRRCVLVMAAFLTACGTTDPRFADHTAPPANANLGRAYIALDVHQYDEGGLMPGRDYGKPATFANVALGHPPLYFPADAWALIATKDRHHPDTILPVEAGTYRLTVLATDQGPTFFGLDTSPVEFTVRPGQLLYLGALEWQREKTSSAFEFQPRYHFDFAVTDELEAHRDALAQAASALPGSPAIQTQLMTLRAASVDVQGHRPSLW